MRLGAHFLQLAHETDDFRAAEQVIARARMNLPLANFEWRQVPHRKIAERFRPRMLAELLGHRSKKFHFAIIAPDPARMIHMRGKSPSRRPSTPPIVRDKVAEGVTLKFHVRTSAQLRLDLRPHRLLME